MNSIGKRLIDYVHEGMQVYDRQGEKLGLVNLVFSGVYQFLPQGNAILFIDLDEDTLHDLLPPERVSAEVREHISQQGFVRVDTGSLLSNRYVLAEQIEAVRSDAINLKVTKDETFRF